MGASIAYADDNLLNGASIPGWQFVHVEQGLAAESSDNESCSSIRPFDTSWIKGIKKWLLVDVDTSTDDADLSDLPSHLPLPTFVQVFEYNDTSSTTDNLAENDNDNLKQMGRAAREIVDSSLGADVVLFRNLSRRVRNAKDFATFWEGCLDGPDGWKPAKYAPFGPQRAMLNGVDLVTPFPPQMALSGHNEMVYNPREPGRVAFFCLQNALEGGETILTRNTDLTKLVSSDLKRMVVEHGGILYRREYSDGNKVLEAEQTESKKRIGISWQDKTGTKDRDGAIKFFTDIGFAEEGVYFNDNGSLVAQNIRSGFIDSPHEEEQKLWFNILSLGVFKLADGTTVPPKILAQLAKDEWKAAHALKLRPGDWIVINNRAVQHGRLPFVDSDEQKRTILTVYTE